MPELIRRSEKLICYFPEYRRGQALFNACLELYPDIANQLRGTDCDPFHNDKRIDAFLGRVQERLNGDNFD